MLQMRTTRRAPLLALLVIGLAACGGSAAPASYASPPVSAAPAASASAKPAGSAAAKPAASGTANDSSATLEQLIVGAKKETTLKTSWSSTSFGGSEGINDLVAQIDKKYGLTVKAQFTPGIDMQSLMTKIVQEAAAGQPATSDVELGNAQTALEGLNKKAFRTYDWKSLVGRPVPADASGKFDPYGQGGSLAFAADVTGVEYNKDLLKGDLIPHKLNDLLKPGLNGKIASTPYVAGWREFATPDMYGEQFMANYLKELSPSISGLIRCGEEQRLSSGEFWLLAMDCGGNNPLRAAADGLPIDEVVLDDATVVHSDYAGVPVNSSAPNTAALVVAYLDTAEGQAWLYKYNFDDLYTFPESHAAAKVKAVRSSGGKVLVDSPEWLNSIPNFIQTQKALQLILAKK